MIVTTDTFEQLLPHDSHKDNSKKSTTLYMSTVRHKCAKAAWFLVSLYPVNSSRVSTSPEPSAELLLKSSAKSTSRLWDDSRAAVSAVCGGGL